MKLENESILEDSSADASSWLFRNQFTKLTDYLWLFFLITSLLFSFFLYPILNWKHQYWYLTLYFFCFNFCLKSCRLIFKSYTFRLCELVLCLAFWKLLLTTRIIQSL